MANHTNREDFAGHDRTSSIDFPSSPPHRVGPAIRRARTTSTIIQRSWSVADDIQMVDMQLPTLPRDETRGTSNSWTTCGATDPNYDAHQDMIRQGVAREEYPYGNNSAGPSGFGIVVVPPVAQREEYSFIQKMNRTYTSTNLGGHSYANSPASFSSSDSTTLAGSSSPIVKHDNKVIAPSSSFAFNSKARRQDKQHPDGGVRAWLCILGCAFMLFTTFGFQTCVGLVLQHLRLNQLKSSSLVEISWIMATFLFLGFAPQAWMAVLFDRYGSHVIAVPASFLYFAMFMILGRCTQYYQFFLTLSVLGGVCCAAITAVGEKVIGHWFKENHGLASFMAMLGAVMGGVFFPLTLKELLESFGWTWAMQGLGFVVLLMLIIGNILVQGRVRSVPTSSKVDWSCFQDGRFTYLIAAMLGFEFLFIMGVGLIPAYVYAFGYNSSISFYLILTFNVCGSAGKLLTSFIAEMVGRYNTLLFTTIVTLFTMIVIWLPFGPRSSPMLYIAVAFFGFGTGSFVSLTMACTGHICSLRGDSASLGRWIASMDRVVAGVTLVAMPMSASLIQNYGATAMVGFSVGILALSIGAVVVSRKKCGADWKWRRAV